VNFSSVLSIETSSNCWLMLQSSVWLDSRCANHSIARAFPRASLVQDSSQQGVFFQDPLIQDVSRGGPMDGFMPVSWKKAPCCGLAPLQVEQLSGEKRYWNSKLKNIFGKHCGLHAVTDSQFAQYRRDMRLDGYFGDQQIVGDFLVGFSQGHEPEHNLLAFCQ